MVSHQRGREPCAQCIEHPSRSWMLGSSGLGDRCFELGERPAELGASDFGPGVSNTRVSDDTSVCRVS
jgi:hypothetical protein